MLKVSQQDWTVMRDADNIAWLTFDKQDAHANILDSAALEELLVVMQSLEKDPVPSGLVIQSGKKNGFIAGADIQQFKNVETPEAALKIIRQGQTVFNYLAALPFPTVALIQGFCVGGGLELSLACRYRVAVDHPKTKLGLPEVMLGIHPGWGGSVRLPRLIGGVKAMDLILSGRSLSAQAAYKMGLVDAAVPERQGQVAARYFVQKQPAQHTATFVEKLSNAAWMRPIVGKWLERKLTERVNRAHYPAPYSALQHWVEHGVDTDAAFAQEAQSVIQLMPNETAQNLVRVFYLQEKLKSLGRAQDDKIEHLHVIGAGVMGGDIAAWCALKGVRVTLQDQNTAAIASALNRALQLFKKQLKAPHLVKAAMDRLMPDVKGFGIRTADLILEAIIEKPEAKKALFLMLEATAKPDAIFATNTSTIPLKEISDHSKTRRRLIGLHFFNPVAKMPLVEVIASEDSDHALAQKCMAFVRAIDKLPIPVKSAPGFLVNRILMPYLLESAWLLEAGVPGEAIDKAALAFGMPMGPVELSDTVGLDVCLYAAESLNHFFPVSIPNTLRQHVEKGHLGKKTGQGFYRYQKSGKPLRTAVAKEYRVPEDVSDRLILSMLNGAVTCLREHVVADADYVDAGMILGAGFPPFRGGPIHYISEQGAPLLVQRLKLLAQRYGDRFLPDPGWNDLKL